MQDGLRSNEEKPHLSGRTSSGTRREFLGRTLQLGAALAIPGVGVSAAHATAAVSDQHLPQQSDSAVGPDRHVDAQIRLNQVGFEPAHAKRAITTATGKPHSLTFSIVFDAVRPKTVFRGTLAPIHVAAPGTKGLHFAADFSNLRLPGRYRLRLADGRLSSPFSIDHHIYDELIPLMAQYFDIQRCGVQNSEFRSTCHSVDGVITNGPNAGKLVDCSGGWHDAGDFLKFVQTTSYVAATMLFAYDHAGPELERACGDSPQESKTPTVLRQARIGLEWLLKMHPSEHEFYYQVGDQTDHNSWRLPESDQTKQSELSRSRPVFAGVGANIAGRTAAALALAARIYRPYDPNFARQCLTSARSSFALGLKNKTVVTTSPADFYPETNWADDMEWGAVALYEATHEAVYLKRAEDFARKAGDAEGPVSLYNVNSLAHFSLYKHAHPRLKKFLLASLESDATDIAEASRKDGYGLGAAYTWGTSSAAAGAALTCLLYSKLSGDISHAAVAQHQLDFVFGCNSFGLCCLIGAGSKYPMFPHHPVANLLDIELSGGLVGGPADWQSFSSAHTPLGRTTFFSKNPSPFPPPDDPASPAVYHDIVQDYVTNEPANDYTATLLLLIALGLTPDDGAKQRNA